MVDICKTRDAIEELVELSKERKVEGVFCHLHIEVQEILLYLDASEMRDWDLGLATFANVDEGQRKVAPLRAEGEHGMLILMHAQRPPSTQLCTVCRE